MGKSVNIDFSEKFVVCDLKVGRYRQLVEFMKLCEYSRSMSFCDHGSRLCTCQKLKLNFPRKLHGLSNPYFM